MRYYIPNQHGAWAMLVLPFLAGMAISSYRPTHALFFLCWLSVYLLSYPLLQWVRTRKAVRYKMPVLLYGAISVPLAAALLLMEPGLLWFGLPMLPLFFVNVRYARINRERALVNDIFAILLFCYVLFPVFYIGEGKSWGDAAGVFAAILLFFAGSALYVKTMIRERGNNLYYIVSVSYHGIIAVLVPLLIHWALAVPFMLLLARSVLFPKLKLKVKHSGLLEIMFTIFIYAAILIIA